jgi:hypothetical protein
MQAVHLIGLGFLGTVQSQLGKCCPDMERGIAPNYMQKHMIFFSKYFTLVPSRGTFVVFINGLVGII